MALIDRVRWGIAATANAAWVATLAMWWLRLQHWLEIHPVTWFTSVALTAEERSLALLRVTIVSRCGGADCATWTSASALLVSISLLRLGITGSTDAVELFDPQEFRIGLLIITVCDSVVRAHTATCNKCITRSFRMCMFLLLKELFLLALKLVD